MQKVQMFELRVQPANGGSYTPGQADAISTSIVERFQLRFGIDLDGAGMSPVVDAEREDVAVRVPRFPYWLTSAGATPGIVLADVVADAVAAAEAPASVVVVMEVLMVTE